MTETKVFARAGLISEDIKLLSVFSNWGRWRCLVFFCQPIPVLLQKDLGRVVKPLSRARQ